MESKPSKDPNTYLSQEKVNELFRAIRQGKLDVVKRYVDDGFDVNEKLDVVKGSFDDDFGSIRYGFILSINFSDSKEKTMLEIACYHKHLHIVKYLVEEASANPELCGNDFAWNERSKASYLSQEYIYDGDACWNARLAIAQYLVEKANVKIDERRGASTMSEYIHAGFTRGYMWLLGQGVKARLSDLIQKSRIYYFLDEKDTKYEGTDVSPETAKFFIENGHTVEKIGHGWGPGHDFLVREVLSPGDHPDALLEAFKNILSNDMMDINALDRNGHSLLWHVVANDCGHNLDLDLYDLLIKDLGAIDQVSEEAESVLFTFCSQDLDKSWRECPYAIEWQPDEIVTSLVKDAHADANQLSKQGDLPVLAAIRRSNWGAVKALLDSGASIDKKNSDGMTAIRCACECNFWERIRFIVDCGASIDAQAIAFWENSAAAKSYFGKKEHHHTLSIMRSLHTNQIWAFLQDLNDNYGWFPVRCSSSTAPLLSMKRKHE